MSKSKETASVDELKNKNSYEVSELAIYSQTEVSKNDTRIESVDSDNNEETTQLDSETRIRVMTPTFPMRGIDDQEEEKAEIQHGDFHVNGQRKSILPESVQTTVAEELTGLCVTCNERNECLKARAEFVVWHCAEYV